MPEHLQAFGLLVLAIIVAWVVLKVIKKIIVAVVVILVLGGAGLYVYLKFF